MIPLVPAYRHFLTFFFEQIARRRPLDASANNGIFNFQNNFRPRRALNGLLQNAATNYMRT